MISGQAGHGGWQAGDVDKGILPVGQAVGRIKDVPTVAELMERIVKQATEVKETLNAIF